MLGTLLVDMVMMAVAAGTLSLLITYSHITKPLRHHFVDAPCMVGELINCPYCMAHWTSIPFAWHIGPYYWASWPLGYVVSWLIVTGLSCLFIGILLKLFLFREGENEELREIVREQREIIQELLEEKS